MGEPGNEANLCLFSGKMGLYNCGVLIYEDDNKQVKSITKTFLFLFLLSVVLQLLHAGL